MKGELEKKLLPSQWTYKGKSLRIFSTSLGLVLASNLMLGVTAYGETPTATNTPTATATAASDQPKLVEWSTEQVKKYYDPNVDWNIPLPAKPPAAQAGTGSTAVEGSGDNTIIVNNNGYGGYGGGIGWTDLLLYHMIFNSGRSYSANQWYGQRPVYVPGTTRSYQTKSFDSNTFQNKPTAGSSVRPATSKTTGTFSSKSSTATKSTSSSKGGIGGTSSSFGSTGKSSGGSFGS